MKTKLTKAQSKRFEAIKVKAINHQHLQDGYWFYEINWLVLEKHLIDELARAKQDGFAEGYERGRKIYDKK